MSLYECVFIARQDISAQTLGARKVNNGRVLLRNHHLVTLLDALKHQVRPGKQKLAGILASRKCKDNLHLY